MTTDTPRDNVVLSQNIKRTLDDSVVRWKRADPAVLSGELKAIINRSDLSYSRYPYLQVADELAVVAKLAASKPDAFRFSDQGYMRAGLGKLIHERTSKLSNATGSADTMLKLWSRSSVAQFAENLLPRLVQQTKSDNRVDFPALLYIIANWDEKRPAIIQTIAEEYFSAKTPKGK